MNVETVYPLRHVGDRPEPFPTIYWLPPGELHRAVADLERRGLIKQLEQRIADDPAFREQVHGDHRRYAEQRWAMLTPQDRKIIENQPTLQRSFRGGVGGVADFDHVKCLHAHVAHALANRNTIGQIVLDKVTANATATTDP